MAKVSLMDDGATGEGVELSSREHATVSFPSEELLLVDDRDRVQGFGSKAELHAGSGLLHRAFSVFLFDRSGRVLLHRRSEEKPLWPGYWTNSCCSHPRRGERLEFAVRRRLREELGVTTDRLQRVYSFEYRAVFGARGTEHELCHVFLAALGEDEQPTVHAGEIMEWGWYTPHEVDALMLEDRGSLTPWFCLEWEALRGAYGAVLDTFIDNSRDPGIDLKLGSEASRLSVARL